MSAGNKGIKAMAAHVGPNMTPMVDIVMCILIFFMLGSSFLMPELFLTSNMAVDQKGLGTESGKATIPSVRLQIDLVRQTDPATQQPFTVVQVGAWNIQMPMGNPNSDEINKIDDPFKRNQRIKEENDKNDAIATFFDKKKKDGLSDDVQFIVAPVKYVPFQDVITVYDACMKARFAKVAFRQAG